METLIAREVRPRRREQNSWKFRYSQWIQISDAAIILCVVGLGQWARFGPHPAFAASRYLPEVRYAVVSLSLTLLWMLFLGIFHAAAVRIVGHGAEEYRRIFGATFALFGLIAIISLLFRIELARGYLAIVFPVGLVALVASRWLWRQSLRRRRSRGDCQTSVLVLGSHDSAISMTSSFERDPGVGYRVVGVCIPGDLGVQEDHILVEGHTIPIFGNEDSVLTALALCGADTVAVTAAEQLGHIGIRKLVWDLEPLEVDLVVAPGVVDVSGPRLAMRPVANLPLIHVDKPQYDGAHRFGKSAFDLSFAVAALIVTAPLLLITAIAIKLTSKGPMFYKSERIGLDGKPFPMIKFRSMVHCADETISALMDQNEGAGGILFKMRDDPRITQVGRIIRRLSIDELPQFINVLRREMSVVGPRPPLDREVAAYDGHVRRRLLVKPGITGLWQVSGRSDLSWDESVRLDLSYVENWSMVGDLLIAAKTAKAVFQRSGAY